jgi:hypothetical protein
MSIVAKRLSQISVCVYFPFGEEIVITVQRVFAQGSPLPVEKIDQQLLIWNLCGNILFILDDRWRHIPQQCKTNNFSENCCECSDTFFKRTGWMEI